jgi:hypothetical protein
MPNAIENRNQGAGLHFSEKMRNSEMFKFGRIMKSLERRTSNPSMTDMHTVGPESDADIVATKVK